MLPWRPRSTEDSRLPKGLERLLESKYDAEAQVLRDALSVYFEEGTKVTGEIPIMARMEKPMGKVLEDESDDDSMIVTQRTHLRYYVVQMRKDLTPRVSMRARMNQRPNPSKGEVTRTIAIFLRPNLSVACLQRRMEHTHWMGMG